MSLYSMWVSEVCGLEIFGFKIKVIYKEIFVKENMVVSGRFES